MDAKLFVDAIRSNVRDAAIEEVIAKLKSPPGRRLLPERKEMTVWFNGLSEEDAKQVRRIVESAVDEAIFGLLAILDGSRTVCEGRFELTHVGKKRVLLNDPEKIGLNEVFNATD